MRSPHLAFRVLALVVAGLSGPVRAAEPTPASVWMHDFTKAQAEARRLNRPLVVHFYSNTCPPCRKMEKEVLNTAPVLRQLDAGFVAVKVNLSEASNAPIQARYQIDSMPTDMILSPEGKVLALSKGYDDRTPADRQKYLSTIARIDAQYAKEGKRLARSEPAAEAAKPAVPSAKPAPASVATVPTATAAAGSPVTVNRLVPDPVEPHKIAEPAGPSAGKPEALEPAPIVLALDGYCPVTLRTTRSWKSGNREFSLEHDGQTFLFVAAENREEFKANPSRYAPKLLGCDPVVLADSDLAVRGSTKFGAFYDGELFLFESAETRARFRKDPARYTRIRHVLKPEDVHDSRKLASAGGQ